MLCPQPSFLRKNPNHRTSGPFCPNPFAHLIPQAQLHSLLGMSLAFLSPSFSLPNMPYLLNLTPTAWPMSVYSCTKRPKNGPIHSHSNSDADKGIPTAPDFPSKERSRGAEHHSCPSHIPGCPPRQSSLVLRPPVVPFMTFLSQGMNLLQVVTTQAGGTDWHISGSALKWRGPFLELPIHSLHL